MSIRSLVAGSILALTLGCGGWSSHSCEAAKHNRGMQNLCKKNSLEALKNAGIDAYYDGRSKQCYKLLSAYISQKNDDPDALFYRGSVSENTKESLRDLDSCILLAPNYAKAYVRRADYKIRQKKYEEAMHDAAMAVNLYDNAQTSEDFWFKSQAVNLLEGINRYNLTGRFSWTIPNNSAAKQCVVLSPSAGSYLEYFRAAIAAQNLDDMKSAIAIISRAIDKYPRKIHLRSLRGMWRENVGDHEGALADFEVFISLASDKNAAPEIQEEAFGFLKDPLRNAYIQRIRILYEMERLPELRAACEELRHMPIADSSLIWAFQQKGRLEAEKGNLNQALADYQISSNEVMGFSFYYERAKLRMRAHQLDSAKADLDKALTLESSNTVRPATAAILSPTNTMVRDLRLPGYIIRASILRSRAYARLQSGDLLGALNDQVTEFCLIDPFTRFQSFMSNLRFFRQPWA